MTNCGVDAAGRGGAAQPRGGGLALGFARVGCKGWEVVVVVFEGVSGRFAGVGCVGIVSRRSYGRAGVVKGR